MNRKQMFGIYHHVPNTLHSEELPLSRVIDRFCHFITALRILRHVSTRKNPASSCIFSDSIGIPDIQKQVQTYQVYHLEGMDSLIFFQ